MALKFKLNQKFYDLVTQLKPKARLNKIQLASARTPEKRDYLARKKLSKLVNYNALDRVAL